MGILIHIKDVRYADLAGAEHPAIGALRAAELIGTGLDWLCFTAQIDGLTHEQALQSKIRMTATDFVRGATRESSHADRIVEAESLV